MNSQNFQIALVSNIQGTRLPLLATFVALGSLFSFAAVLFIG